jgi:hypothetical protein
VFVRPLVERIDRALDHINDVTGYGHIVIVMDKKRARWLRRRVRYTVPSGPVEPPMAGNLDGLLGRAIYEVNLSGGFGEIIFDVQAKYITGLFVEVSEDLPVTDVEGWPGRYAIPVLRDE